jgi:hypothetical protein
VWSGWDLLFLFCFTAFSVMMLAAVGEAAKHFVHSKFPSLRFLVQSPNEGIYLFLFQALLDLLILLFIYFTITLKYNAPFSQSLKWQPREGIRLSRYIPVGVALALAVLGASTLFPNPQESPIEKLIKVPLTAFATLGVSWRLSWKRLFFEASSIQWWNAALGRPVPLWQRRYFSRECMSANCGAVGRPSFSSRWLVSLCPRSGPTRMRYCLASSFISPTIPQSAFSS